MNRSVDRPLQELRRGVEGLSPDAEKHEFFFDIEPVSWVLIFKTSRCYGSALNVTQQVSIHCLVILLGGCGELQRIRFQTSKRQLEPLEYVVGPSAPRAPVSLSRHLISGPGQVARRQSSVEFLALDIRIHSRNHLFDTVGFMVTDMI